VARAVTASSAVPLVFNPVVLEDYKDCAEKRKPDWEEIPAQRIASNPALAQIVRGLETYSFADRTYVHLVDGGITDNLGLRAIYTVMLLSGGPQNFYSKTHHTKLPRHIAVISVNASTDPEPAMDETNKQPSIGETIDSMSNVQLHLYNDATIDLMQNSLAQWTKGVSTPDWPVRSHFVKLGFTDIKQPEQRQFFNSIPTSFSLTEEQVDRLIEAGHELLRNNPDYQQFLAELGGAVTGSK
jgi:NTE family protein